MQSGYDGNRLISCRLRWALFLVPFVVLLCWPAAAAAESEAPAAIPVATKAPVLDGSCDVARGEYGDAAVFDFADAFGVTGKVFLKHDGVNLYACMFGASSVNSTVGPFASLYLDTDDGREQFAQVEDLGLRVSFSQTGSSLISAVRGTGSSNYTPDPTVTGWDAQATTGNFDQAEWTVPLDLISTNRCDAFGVAVYHHWIRFVGDDYGWPSATYYDSPQTWVEMRLGGEPCGDGTIAYVYRRDDVTAGQFKAMLEARGFTVLLVRISDVLATDFSTFDLTIIADDTGVLDEWPSGVAGVSPEAGHIRSGGRPVMGLGEGGYAFFGKHGFGIGWPNGWHGPLDRVSPRSTGLPYWRTPTDFGAAPPDPFGLYTVPVNEVGIYLPSAPTAVELGVEPVAKDHAPLIYERGDCYQLWGFSGGPPQLTAGGENLFVNAVLFGMTSQCTPPPSPQQCVTLEKTADPAAGTPVGIGAVISYTIKYTVSSAPGCGQARAVLEDAIPDRTLFVPGSAGAGIAPGADGVLRWNVGPLAAGATGQRHFAVSVADSVCNGQRVVVNQARMAVSGGVYMSNLVTHPVDCPPVVPAGTQPPYAEDEIQLYPYPLVAGRLTEVSVRVRNLTVAPKTVQVTFESSPNNFGIGVPFGALPAAGNPRVVTLPPNGVVEVKLLWTPARSGHYCIRVKIQGVEGGAPVYTYRNLDVMENLQPGVTDVLTFSVGNPTAGVATVDLVVDNTCPGWSATVNPAQLVNMAPGEVRQATLSVTPPTDHPLGTACHIDVQGWIGSQLIGGIRKLDVPPVNLPHANPPWEEQEISMLPDPPVLNQPGQVCIELQNPMPFTRTVSVDFSWAAFGAGIGFTPLASLNSVTLPANSIDRYCVNWTPAPVSNGSLHRCIQVRLRQDGFEDQFSQRNIDVRRVPLGTLSDVLALQIPFSVGNTHPFTVPLAIEPLLIGLPPELVLPKILPDPPPELGPGQQLNFTLGFVAGAAEAGAATVDASPFVLGNGDKAGVEVGILLDGESAGGFSVEFENHRLFLPTLSKGAGAE